MTKHTLRLLARRATALEDEVRGLDQLLKPLVADTAPELAAVVGVGTDVASALLVAAGDNPERLKRRGHFRSPLRRIANRRQQRQTGTTPAQPRWGDRQANAALWHIVLTRMVCDPRTRHYIERRIKEGRTKKEAVRCLKRYVAREVYQQLPRPGLPLDSP